MNNRACEGDWPGVAPHSRRACHDIATLDVGGKRLCLIHGTRALTELLSPENFPPLDPLLGRALEELQAMKHALRNFDGKKEG